MIRPHARPVLVLVAVSVTAACGSSSKRTPSQYDTAYLGICRAAREAGTGNLDQARRTFLDRSHGPLHQLATAAQGTDRSVAGDLLEAKQAVEAELARPTAQTLAHKLTQLAARTATAISTAGDDRPEPCSTKEP